MSAHGHTKADARHLHLHAVALRKLENHPELAAKVLALIDRWLGEGLHEPSRPWLERWREMLTNWPFEQMVALVLDDDAGQQLRQCSPLAPVLTPQERWAALADLKRPPP